MIRGVLCAVLVAGLAVLGTGEISDRTPRSGLVKALLPYFNLRFVYPFECETDSKRTGTCMSHKDCKTAGGNVSGTCAKGYGSCCQFEAKCGATVTRNRTYLVSTDDEESGSLNCKYTIKKPTNDSAYPFYRNVCQVRLDFEDFTLAQPAIASDADPNQKSMCLLDSFELQDTSAAFGKICGDNDGQHIYLPVGNDDTIATIKIVGDSASTTDRKWIIRTTYIPCEAYNAAPSGCLQYYHEDEGTINSFNAKKTQVGGLSYSACVSSDASNCGLTLNAETFSLSGNAAAGEPLAALKGSACTPGDSLGLIVQAKGAAPIADSLFCGTAFTTSTTLTANAPVTTHASPFALQVYTDKTELDGDDQNKGFSLKYTRDSC